MRNAFMNGVFDACEEREDIFVITGDAGLGVFDEFKEKMPGRYLNMGIAEQNMASFAAGLTLSGYKVFMYNIAPFLLYRCYEQVRNDICYQNLSVVMAGIGSGLTYAPGGMTHYSVEDIGLARTLPNLTVISPADPVEASLAAEFALRSETPVYVRLAKRGEPVIHANKIFDISRPVVVEDGNDVAFVFHGSVAPDVLDASKRLREAGLKVRVVSIPMVQPLDLGALLSVLEGVGNVYCVEEHFAGSGLGNIIASRLAEGGATFRFNCLGIEDKYIHAVKDTDGMRKHFGISGQAIAERVLADCRKGRA